MQFKKLMDNFLIHYLNQFDKHCFNIRLHDEMYTIGKGEPEFTVIVHKDIPKSELLSSTELALGEAYMRGDIEIQGDLFHMLCTFLDQADRFSLDRKGLRGILYMSEKKKDQAKEVSSHYDLGNEFYKLWLDPTMSYSCAYFKHEDDTLEQAQRNKVDYILEKLYLKQGMTLLDIGCGWGFLLIEAAKKYGVKGYGCTLSKEQWKKSQERIKAEGLEGMVTIDLVDYRDLEDKDLKFDRIVSVGMMEHVGRSNYATYMETANHLLKDGGIFLLHTITGHDEVSSRSRGSASTSSRAARCRRCANSSPMPTTPTSASSTSRACAATTTRRSCAGTTTFSRSTTRWRAGRTRSSCACGISTSAAAQRRSTSATSTSIRCS